MLSASGRVNPGRRDRTRAAKLPRELRIENRSEPFLFQFTPWSCDRPPWTISNSLVQPIPSSVVVNDGESVNDFTFGRSRRALGIQIRGLRVLRPSPIRKIGLPLAITSGQLAYATDRLPRPSDPLRTGRMPRRALDGANVEKYEYRPSGWPSGPFGLFAGPSGTTPNY